EREGAGGGESESYGAAPPHKKKTERRPGRRPRGDRPHPRCLDGGGALGAWESPVVRGGDEDRTRMRAGNASLFFQPEGGIRNWSVTGVQTCALPISFAPRWEWLPARRECRIRGRGH